VLFHDAALSLRDNIILVEEPVPNHVSSTKVRQLLAEQQPVRFLVPDAVIAFIKQHGLYQQQQQQQQK
jgi:nicotinamide mononucleotide adenylyltransferase